MTRPTCSAVEERWIAAIEPVCSHHTHLCPVGEEYVVFKHSDPKRMWRLGHAIKNYFPDNQEQVFDHWAHAISVLSDLNRCKRINASAIRK